MGLTSVDGTPRRRRRRAFSLNGLAIQLSAFALSFTLVALLVVTGSQAAFVEENEIVTNHVPLGLPAEDGDEGGPWPRSPRLPASDSPAAEPTVAPVVDEPVEPVEPEPPQPSVELIDADAGTAMFTDGTVLAPGAVLDRCISVTYLGDTEPSAVLLYAAEASGELAPYLDLVVEMGPATGEPFGSCAGFVASDFVYSGTVADFGAASPDYESGIPTWNPAESGEARSFRFRLAVRDHADAEGKATSFGFTWETRAE
jgi:hypothetical protein